MKTLAAILFLLSSANLFAADADNIMPPLPPSPIPEFRQWLALPAAERTAALAGRKSRETLEAKLREYEGLSASERERRLCAVEVHWYLTLLMGMPREQRGDALTQVPSRLSRVVGARLRQWEKFEQTVGPDQKKEILGNTKAVEYLSSPQPKEPPMPQVQLVQARLTDFFKMPAREQEKALDKFSASERNEMIATLKAFRALPAAQRAECLNSFGQFATMSAEEQVAFLRNADRWQAMPKKDRDTWRGLVNAVPPMPPLPDDLIVPPIPSLQ